MANIVTLCNIERAEMPKREIKWLTVSHPKDDPRILDRLFHLEAVFRIGRHGLLTQYVITQRRECQHDLPVHVVMDSNNDGVCKSSAQHLDGLLRGLEEIGPGAEDESFIDSMRSRERLACLLAWLGDGYDLARLGLVQRILRIELRTLRG